MQLLGDDFSIGGVRGSLGEQALPDLPRLGALPLLRCSEPEIIARHGVARREPPRRLELRLRLIRDLALRRDDESFAEAVAAFRRLSKQAQRLLAGVDRLVVATGVQIVGGHDLVTASVVGMLGEMRLDARDRLGELGCGGGGLLPARLERLIGELDRPDLQIKGEGGGGDQRGEPEGDRQPQPSRAAARRRALAFARRKQSAGRLEPRRLGVFGTQPAFSAFAFDFSDLPGVKRPVALGRIRRRASEGERRQERETGEASKTREDDPDHAWLLRESRRSWEADSLQHPRRSKKLS